MATNQSQAIALANQVAALMQQIAQLRQTVNDVVTQYNDQGASTAWNAFPTAALNTDGSLGTADGSPNNAHPIDTRVAAMSALNRAQSATNYVNAVAALQALQAFLTNAAVATSNRNAIIDLFVGG